MKRGVVFILVLCAFYNINAQETPKLNIPSTPAFSILDFEPSAVMRPTTAKGLASDVLNSFDKDGKLLMNLGLEVTPYWLKSHPDLTRKKYLNPTVGQAFKQTFTLSAATVKDSSTGNNKLGAGFKFRLADGRPTDELEAADKQLIAHGTILNHINVIRTTLEDDDTKAKVIEAILENLRGDNIDNQIIQSIKTKSEALSADFGETKKDLQAFLEKLIEILDEEALELKQKVSELVYDRKGFILEFASATGYNSTDQKLDRLGFWGNASYFVSPNDFFTLTGRYLRQNNDTSVTNIDIGLGFLKKNQKYNISIEGMFRWYRAEIPDLSSGGQPITRLDKDFTYRLAVQGSYIISKDISINISIGKDFDSPFISKSGVFSILGLNYSLFSKEPQTLE
jgi:hypothetical protein